MALLAMGGCAGWRGADEVELPFVAQPAPFAIPDGLRGSNAGIDGEVLVAVLIDSSGKLSDWLVLGSSDPRLEPVAVDAVQHSAFAPARHRGRAVAGEVGIVISFADDPPTMSTREVESLGRPQSGRASAARPRFFQIDQLDAVPRLIHDVKPASANGHGSVKVQFFIDTSGSVRLPAVIESTDPILGRAVLDAVTQWQFTAPRRGGQPVLAIARQEFRFRQ